MSANDLVTRAAELSPTAQGATPPARFSRAQKAAAVLLAVGSDAAAKVLSHLTEAEVEQVAFEVATLGNVSRSEFEPVLEEFYAEVSAHNHLLAGGESHARDMLRKLRGSEGDDIVDRALATVQASPFQFLRQHEPSEIAPHLRDEHPQTVALILAHLPPKFAARVLEGLELGVQSDVALRIATLDRTSPDVIARVEEALQSRLGNLARSRDSEQGGVKDLASMLNNADRHTEQSILGALEERDAELAERVRELMFVFEDIVTLDQRAVQEILRQVDMKQVAVALKGVGDDVRETVERILSERARESLSEEIELLGPVRIREVEAAQGEVVRRIRQLEDEGVIDIERAGEDEFIE